MIIKSRDKKTKVLYIICPKCKKEIKGSTPSQVEYNMKLHLAKHEKDKELKK